MPMCSCGCMTAKNCIKIDGCIPTHPFLNRRKILRLCLRVQKNKFGIEKIVGISVFHEQNEQPIDPFYINGTIWHYSGDLLWNLVITLAVYS